MWDLRILLPACATLLLALPLARAQDYPNRPITLVVPYAAGGGNDAMARIVADKMSKTLGQQIVIENRGGAGGTIATRAVARAAPDGYTLVLGGTGTLAVNPTLYANVGYDPRKDFAPVGLIATSALVILVHPSVEAHSIAELIALAKSAPGKLNYASAGPGSGIHLGTELFASMAGIKLTHIAYRGSAPALNDLLGGHVQNLFQLAAAGGRHRRRGQGAGARRHRGEARQRVPRSADGGGSRIAGLRGGAALRHRCTRRHAAANRRYPQCGLARRTGPGGDADRARRHRRRGAAQHSRGIRSRHRPGGDQVVAGRERGRHKGELTDPEFDLALSCTFR